MVRKILLKNKANRCVILCDLTGRRLLRPRLRHAFLYTALLLVPATHSTQAGPMVSTGFSQQPATFHTATLARNCRLWFALNDRFQNNPTQFQFSSTDVLVLKKVLENCRQVLKLTDQITAQAFEHQGLIQNISGKGVNGGMGQAKLPKLWSAFLQQKNMGAPPVRPEQLNRPYAYSSQRYSILRDY